jgi:hypothetical protein
LQLQFNKPWNGFILAKEEEEARGTVTLSSMEKFKCTLGTAFNLNYDLCSEEDQTQQCMNNPVDSFGARKT